MPQQEYNSTTGHQGLYSLAAGLQDRAHQLSPALQACVDQGSQADITSMLNAVEQLAALIGNSETAPGLPEPHPEHRDLVHDIRNLIGVIKGYGELIQEELQDTGKSDVAIGLADMMDRLNSLNTALSPANAAPDAITSKFSLTSGQSIPGTILAIDDNPDNLAILSRHLEKAGHHVLTADCGETALAILEKETIDLIFLDLVMPGISGFEVLNRLKQDDNWRAIPVIMISGQHDTEEVIRCIEAGADDYLRKPFNPVLLNARLNAGLERKRWHDREIAYQDELERNHRFIRNTFGRYLSDDIVDNLLEREDGLDLGGKLCEVTILMADIRGFTAICEKLEPQRIVTLLNNYLGGMSEVIMQHGGTVDEFIGDAILAIFGAPLSASDDTDRAIRCALAMQDAIKTINQRNVAENLPEIGIGIGLNTGTVVAGNIGSEKRSKYGVVGHPVNVTARIESRTEGGEILASQAVIDASSEKLQIGRQFTTQPKGIVDHITIYQITGIEPKPGEDSA
jgi:class 3 adenylate cyclase